MFTILIIEDEEKIRSILDHHLTKWQFKTILADKFDRLDALLMEANPHLVLLDINLPSFNGFYWCEKFRQNSNVPVIFLSSRSENMDIVMAMNAGGDDYIQKPFSLDVLTAKINAVLRRTYSYQSSEKEYLEYDGLVLNIQKSSASFDGSEVSLSKNEFHILYLLMKKSGQIVSRENIMKALWEDEQFIDDNTLTVNVARLRRKLDELGFADRIATKKRQGYILS